MLLMSVSLGYCSENQWGETDTNALLKKVVPGYLQSAGTALGGATSMATSVSEVPVGYSVVKKQVAAAAQGDQTGTLADGTKGQILKIIITGVGSGGAWVLTPTTKTGFSTLTFDAALDEVTLLFVDSTIGWILIHSISVTVGAPTGW